ncbi:MAG: RsmG family class I SAM-dependent methyltransferase [Polyangiaceae bacterium]
MTEAEALRARVERVATALGGDVPGAALDRVVAWCAMVKETNARIDLTAARSDDELVDLLVADAVVLAGRVAKGVTVVDVGSGAGAPGLPLALLRQDLEVTLVEPLDKRVSFLRSAIGRAAAGARLPRVVRGRGESLVGKGTFGVAISRATLPPDEWLALGSRLAADVWVLLATTPLTTGEPVEAVDYVWPLTGVARRAVRVSVL